MKTSAPYSFQFQAQELPQKLSQLSQQPLTGYWLFEFPGLAGTNVANQWYLGLSKGQVVFSGNQHCCWSVLFETLQRYTARLRNGDAKHAILRLEQQLMLTHPDRQASALLDLLHELNELNLLNLEEVRASLRLKMLSDFDTYVFEYAGQAKFLPSSSSDAPLPIVGFEMDALVSQAKERRVLWQKLKTLIPSMEHVPTLNAAAAKLSQLNAERKQRLEALVADNKTLSEIAVLLAQDPLEIAKFFAKLMSEGLIKLRSSPTTKGVEIFVVDDSPILLKQFESLVRSWGYCVRSFYEPMLALEALTEANPAVIFLDINMPEVTGFDLVKQIRRLPGLESIPLIMLTAEKSLSNNWRARWSGCQFMSKPLTSSEIPTFRLELRTLLTELAPLQQPTQFSGRRSEFQMETSY
ncbi:response regulator [Stenomitos frigidus]|nr:response regulator [Stenomitos frigidus]